MIRLLASIVLLCTQVLAVLSTGNLVLCIHEDGECAVELIGSECCRAAHEAEERRPDRGNGAQGAVASPLADRCTDVPYKLDQTSVAHGSQLRSASSHAARTVPSAVLVWTNPAAIFAVRVERFSARGPPPQAVPRAPRAFILRC